MKSPTSQLKAALQKRIKPITWLAFCEDKHADLDAIIEAIELTIQPEIERLVVEARVDELSRVNSHLIDLKVSVPAIQKAPKPIGQYVLDRVAQLTQSNQKEGKDE